MTLEEFIRQRQIVIQELMNVNKNLKYIDISDRASAIIGVQFALLFQFGRGETNITYLRINEQKVVIEYPINNFLASSLNANDRRGIIRTDGLYENAITDLTIIVRGLSNHWSIILNGSKEWIAQYEESRYFYEPRPTKLIEGKIIQDYLCNT